MAKVRCVCGHVFKLSTEAPESYSLVPEQDIENAVFEATQHPLNADQLTEFLDRRSRNVLICPQCGRLLLEGENGTYQFYQHILTHGG
jgi:hypothetical protein